MSGRMDGKTVVVTGGASGIGLATAALLAAEGARVAIGDLDAGAAAAKAATLPGDALGLGLDVADEEQVAAFFDAVLAQTEGLDAIVHCAGTGGMPVPVTATDTAMWRHVVDVNLTGTMLTFKHGAQHIRDGGSIVAIASLNATQPGRGMGAYASSKAAVAMLVKVAALELGGRGVRVNAIAPGLVATPLSAPLVQPGLVEEYLDNTPLGRYGDPEDVARAVLFLASDDSTWLTGDLITLAGGAQLQRYPDLLAKLAPDTVVGR